MVARNLFGLASAFHFKTKNCLENVTFHSRYYVIAKEIVFPFCSWFVSCISILIQKLEYIW